MLILKKIQPIITKRKLKSSKNFEIYLNFKHIV